MSQNNVDYSQNPTGAELMDDYLAAVLANALTTNSGIQRPVYAKAGTFWVDTSVTPWLLKMYNGTKDVLFGEIGTDANGNFTVVNAANLDLNNITNSAVNRIRGIAGKPYNIGQIYQSTIPLTDAGLHLLDGTVLVGNGIYKEFVDYIADLYNAGTATDSFLTEVQWQAEVTNKGICGKFVYDSANNTVRLPLFGNKITCSENELITVGSSESPKTNQIWGTTTDNNTVSFAVSDANLIDGYYYIAVANQTKTDIEVDIDQIATDLAGKANTDLSNLTLQGQNIANWSNNVTNCITEIPQDIKLELVAGTLTLKAGSKVYVPNGAGVFDVVTVASDLSTTRSTNSQEMYFVSNNGTVFNQWANIYSGTSAPSGQTYMVWYDTANNIVKVTGNGGSTWIGGFSLPVCLATSNNTQITSIDQVFNGFGYIGSIVFALPGVKGLIPNGRNADGSLKNIEFVNDRVKTFTLLNSETSILNLYDATIGIDIATYSLSNFFIQNNAPTNYQHMLWLDTLNNEFKYTENTGNSWVKINLFNCAKIVSTTNGKITSFTPKTVFHALDYNDKTTYTPLIKYDSLPTNQYGGTTIGTYTLLDNIFNYDYLMVTYNCNNAMISKQTMIDKISAFSLPTLAAISLSRGNGASEYYIHEADFTISGNQINITSNIRTPVAGVVDTEIGQVRFLDIQGIKF